MAQGNLFQGQAAGKIGDVVFMVRKGKQVSRVYTTAGARSGDAATEATRLQRVKFGSASNQWSIYKYVCDKMYLKGKKTKESSYNYFVKRNIEFLPYLTKSENASGVDCIQPGLMAEGSLGAIELFYAIKYEEGETRTYYDVKDKTAKFSEAVTWDAPMSDLQTQLKLAYPNATKVNYLVGIATNYDVEQDAFISVSQSITYYNVIIDLFEDYSKTAGYSSVAKFFSAKIGNAEIKAILADIASDILKKDGTVFEITESKPMTQSVLNTLLVTIFATNNNVNDVYTTNIPMENVPNAGIWRNWYGYRTNESLQVAMNSYGYQAGVMRDDVAKVQSTAANTLNAYAKKLAAYDPKAAEQITKTAAEQVQTMAKAMRKKKEQEETT